MDACTLINCLIVGGRRGTETRIGACVVPSHARADIKGKVKDAAGGLTGDTSLQAEGKWDQLKGKAQKKIGEVQRDSALRDDDNI